MDNERIATALKMASDTRCFLPGDGVLSKVDAVFSECFGTQAAVVVADQNTFEVAGAAVNAGLGSRIAAAPIVFVACFAFTDDCMGGHSPCPHADDVKEGGDLLEFANDCLLLFR